MTCPSCGRDVWVCTDQARGDYYWCPGCHRRWWPEEGWIVAAKKAVRAELRDGARLGQARLPFSIV